MKKILILFSMLMFMVGISMASVIGLPNDQDPIKEADGKVQVQWKFTPEVETRVGYNFDNSAFGLKGKIETDISLFFLDGDAEFVGEEAASGKGVWGKIKVTDLEAKIDISNKPNDYNSTSTTTVSGTELSYNTQGLNINWESITAWVYFGPNIYIKMGDINHFEVRYVDSIADSDFSAINYSVIPPYFTGSYLGRLDTDTVLRGGDGDVTNTDPYFLRVGTDSQYLNNTGLGNDNLNGFALGISIPEKITLELGAQTKYHYEERIVEPYNPFNFSLLLETTAIENLKVGVKVNATSGNKTDDSKLPNLDQGFAGVTTNNNPLAIGGSLAYTIPRGQMNIVPILAGEVMFEERRKINTASSFDNLFDPSTQQDWKNGYIMTIPAEIALGVTINWKSLGHDAKESDHLTMASKDVKVTDGLSIIGLFGEMPFEAAPEIPNLYAALQIALWESEEDGKPGIVPGLKAGLITNLNYAFGGTYDVKDLASGSSLTFSKYEFTNAARIDFGIGTELSYKVNKITPYLGVIFKALDIAPADEKLKTEGDTLPATHVLDETSKIGDRYTSRVDLRVKLGADFSLSSNVTLNAEWKSGDLLYNSRRIQDQDENFAGRGYGDYDYFKNNNAKDSTLPSFASTARGGVMSVGVKVAF